MEVSLPEEVIEAAEVVAEVARPAEGVVVAEDEEENQAFEEVRRSLL